MRDKPARSALSAKCGKSGLSRLRIAAPVAGTASKISALASAMSKTESKNAR